MDEKRKESLQEDSKESTIRIEVNELKMELKKLEEQYDSVILPEEKSAEREYEEKTNNYREIREEMYQKEKEKDIAEKRWTEAVKQSRNYVKKIQKIQKKIDRLCKDLDENAGKNKDQSDERKFKIFPKDKNI